LDYGNIGEILVYQWLEGDLMRGRLIEIGKCRINVDMSGFVGIIGVIEIIIGVIG
jgi:hypothetical protein